MRAGAFFLLAISEMNLSFNQSKTPDLTSCIPFIPWQPVLGCFPQLGLVTEARKYFLSLNSSNC